MNNSETETGSARPSEVMMTLKKLKEELETLKIARQKLLFMLLIGQKKRKLMMESSKPLLDDAIKTCQDEATRLWLRENSDSFFQLADMFQFLKEKIDEEEKKNHSDTVDIIFVAHGSIRSPMIPASCLFPLSSITDLVLYSPWNCVTNSKVTYGVATGRIQPQQRVFYCSNNKSCKIRDKDHQPTKLPNHWNSLKKAGAQKIPTITVSPLQAEDGVWEAYKLLTKTYGPPGRNRIIIPFIIPEDRLLDSSESVPVYVVTLALSLVLLSSRFKATVHLDTCLTDQSGELKADEDSLKQQYAYAINDTGMDVSQETFRESWSDYFRRLFTS